MAVQLVQEIDQVDLAAAAPELTLTVPAGGVQEGHSILLAIAFLPLGGGEIQASDSAGNLYTVDLEGQGPPPFGAPHLAMLSAHDVLALAPGDEIVISWTGGETTGSFNAAVALEVSGLTGEVAATADGGGLDAEPSSGATLPTAQNNVFAFGAIAAAGAGGELTPGGGWTALTEASSYAEGVGGYTLFPLYRVLPSGVTAAAEGALSSSRPWAAGLVTYLGEITMGDPTSWRGFAGIAIEATPGTAVKSLYKLDLISETLRGTGEPIELDTIVESRMVEKVVMGPYEEAGDLVYNVTPDIATTLLYAVLTNLGSQGSGDPYVHTFKTGTTLKSLTAQIYRDDFYFVYAGLYPSKLSFRVTAEEVLQATCSLGGRAKERIYDTHQSDAGVIYSSAAPFVFHQASVELHGGAFADSMNWVIDIDTGLLRNRGLGGGRAHNRAFAGKSKVSGSFDLLFDSIEAHRRWMGASSSSYPIDVGDTVQHFAAHVLYTAASGRKIKFEFPQMYYKASSPEHRAANGMVVQPCTWGTKRDSATGSDIVVTITNSESPAAITTAGVAI